VTCWWDPTGRPLPLLLRRSEAGSDIAGLEELLELADSLPVHVAHVNSYCRGQHTGDPLLKVSALSMGLHA
jgi:hypothetical protein